MGHGLVLTLHLLAAVAFAGTVFFEVVVLQSLYRKVPREALRAVEQGIGNRAVRVMPVVLLLLYLAGISLAWGYRAALAHPLASHFALLLTIKIVLATSVLGHFITAMAWRRRGTLDGRRSRKLHLSVFVHVLVIVVLAKAMFYL